MAIDRRLSRVLHGLIHMSQHEGIITSEILAKMFDTNPVVVRRMMAGLRKNDIVKSIKGHGGGWMLVKKTHQISLLDIQLSLSNEHPFSIGMANEKPDCLVQQAVNNALEDSLDQAKALLYEKFSQVTLADIAKDFEQKLKQVKK